MIRQKKVQQVIGRDVLTSDGKWQRIIGNNVVYPGCYVWADGNVVYGNLMQRGTIAPAVFSPDKYVLPLMDNSVNEKGQTGEYTINLPALEESYDTFFPRTGTTGAFACTSNFYLTTTHDNLLDFCVADATEKNAPPARLVNAIKQGTIDEYCETSSYTLHSVDYRDKGNYAWMERYCKEYTQIQRNDRVDVQSVSTEVIRDEEHVVYHNVKEFELGETETGSQSASVITDDKAVIKTRGTDGVVDINQRILDTYGKELKDILEGYELKQPSITEIKTDVVDGRINSDGYWMIRVKSKLFATAYLSWKYDDSYTTVTEKHLDIVTKLVDVGLGLKAWYSKLVNGTEISFEKMDFQDDIPFIYQETLDFLMDSNGNFTMLKREISNLKSDTTGEKVENNIDIPVHGEWVEKGEAAPSLKADEYMKVEGNCSDGEVEIYLNGLEAEYKREVIRKQKNYEYRRIYRHVDKNIYLVLENKDGMVIDLPLGKGNTARLAVHLDNEKYPLFSIVMMYDAQGNEYDDMAGWALACIGFFDMEIWRGNVFFLKAFVGETSKRRKAYVYSRQPSGNFYYLASHNAQLTSRIAVMKKRDLKNGALVDWN